MIIAYPSVEFKEDESKYILTKPLIYHHRTRGFIVVPPGFKTDLASVPKCFRWLIDNDEKKLRFASIIHDAAYAGKLDYVGINSKEEADELLFEILEDLGYNKCKLFLIKLAFKLKHLIEHD